LPENEHAKNKKDSIDNTGNDYPFKQPVCLYKAMSFSPGLDSYDNFFEQSLNLYGKYKLQGTRNKPQGVRCKK
jgi:hypothetical protein